MKKNLHKTTKKVFNFNSRSESGITLLILVVTIIVMIILAGVSVRIAVGDDKENGIIQSTSEQKKDQVQTVDNEAKKMNDMIQSEDVKDWGF